MNISYRPIERWPRELTRGRKRSPFRTDYNGTMRLLERELRHAGARKAVVQLALDESQFRVSDGKPYANATPTHPGVIVSFEKGTADKPMPLAFPCDAYLTWIENLRAIALALDALRRVDRYGVTKHAEQYRGWNALPPAGPAIVPAMSVEQSAAWLARAVEGNRPPAELIGNAEAYRACYRAAAFKFHPDRTNGLQRHEWGTLQQVQAVLDKHHGLKSS